MRSTEYPYYEDIELLERPKPPIESRNIVASSSSEDEEGSITLPEFQTDNHPSDANDESLPDTNSKFLSNASSKSLSDAQKEFDKTIREYQDQLAAKDLEIIMLQVQLESLKEKSGDVIDNVIAKTQKHMQSEVENHKKEYQQKIAKITSETKEYIQQKKLEHEKEIAEFKNEIAELKKEIGSSVTPPSSKDKSAVESQELLQKELKKYAALENKVNKNTQVINLLSQEKKELKRKLDQLSAASSETIEKPKTTPFDIISTLLLAGANLLFIFVIFPNFAASNWIETIGLNDLSLTVRVLITVFGIMISLFCFVKAKSVSSRRKNTGKKKRKGHSLNFLLGVIMVGSVFLAIFLFSSNFLFFLAGTLLITLSGLLVVIDHGKSLREQKAGSKKQGGRFH